MPLELQNPYRDPHVKPDWAQFSRLAGDRAAILFEELRAAIGDIEGLREDVCFVSQDVGWAPRYRLGEKALFVVRVLPGFLEPIMELERGEREALLAARGISRALLDVLQRPEEQHGGTVLHGLLENRSQVRNWARLVKARSRLAARQVRN